MKKYIKMAAVAIMFAACSNDDMPETPAVDSMTDTPITLTAGVADLASRAEHDTGELKTGSLGFYMTTKEAPSDNRYNAENREVKYENNQWNVQGDKLLWRNETSTVNYIAYHPYDMTVANNTVVFTTPKTQSLDLVDFLYANGATTGGDSKNGINLTMNHQMSKIFITLRTGSEFGSPVIFKNVAINGIKNQCEFDLATGVWKTFDAETAPEDIVTNKLSNNEYIAIVIPQTLDEFTVEIITEDDRTFVFKRNDVTLAQGTAYTLALVVGKDKVEIADGGIGAGDWVNNDGNSTLETN